MYFGGDADVAFAVSAATDCSFRRGIGFRAGGTSVHRHPPRGQGWRGGRRALAGVRPRPAFGRHGGPGRHVPHRHIAGWRQGHQLPDQIRLRRRQRHGHDGDHRRHQRSGPLCRPVLFPRLCQLCRGDQGQCRARHGAARIRQLAPWQFRDRRRGQGQFRQSRAGAGRARSPRAGGAGAFRRARSQRQSGGDRAVGQDAEDL